MLCSVPLTVPRCRNTGGEIRGGEFFFPVSGAMVPNFGGVINGYYRYRGSQLINLHRQPSGTITGWFRCNIPQASAWATKCWPVHKY